MLAGDAGAAPDHEPLETVTLDVSASLLRVGQFQSTVLDAGVCYCPGALLNLRAGYLRLYSPGFAAHDRIVPSATHGRVYLGVEVLLGGWLTDLGGSKWLRPPPGVLVPAGTHDIPVREEVILAVPMLQALLRSGKRD